MKPVDCLELYSDADFYDAEFSDRKEDLEFYRDWARTIRGPVLELACGTGRITLPLAREGMDLSGLDVSKPMVEKAMEKSRKENLAISWVHGDCRDFQLGRKFSLIFMATNALQHLHDLESVGALFRCVKAHLLPEGVFLFDVFNPDPSKLGKRERHSHKRFSVPGTPETIEVDAANDYDPLSKILSFDLFYSQPSRKDFFKKHVTMRCFFPEEVDAMCRENGFEILDKFGGFDRSPFKANSFRQVIVCKPA